MYRDETPVLKGYLECSIKSANWNLTEVRYEDRLQADTWQKLLSSPEPGRVGVVCGYCSQGAWYIRKSSTTCHASVQFTKVERKINVFGGAVSPGNSIYHAFFSCHAAQERNGDERAGKWFLS